VESKASKPSRIRRFARMQVSSNHRIVERLIPLSEAHSLIPMEDSVGSEIS
jgi:hypothetical protein